MKASIAKALHALGLERQFGARMARSHFPLIIGYHRVVENFEESARQSIPSMLVGVDTFDLHLDWIGQHYDYATLDEVRVEYERLLRNGPPRKRPLAAITFDDGYADVLHNAVPILNRKGIPSAMFVVTNLVGSTHFQMHDELYLLGSNLLQLDDRKRSLATESLLAALMIDEDRARMLRVKFAGGSAYEFTRAILEMLSDSEQAEARHWLQENIVINCAEKDAFRALSWDEVRIMRKKDVTIGSHTRSHALLPEVSPETLEDELKESRRTLEQALNEPVEHFAYPDGRFCRPAIEAVADAGYRAAYTICTHRDNNNPLFTIPRKVFWEKTCNDRHGRFSPAILSCQVNGIFDPARLCTHQHGTL